MNRTRRGAALVALSLAGSLLAQAPAGSHDIIPQVARGLVPPVGFGLTEFAQTPGFVPGSLTFGPDGRLYVAVTAEGVSAGGLVQGKVLAFEDLGGIAGPPQEVAGGLSLTLGITFGPDGTLYASDNTDPFTGDQKGAVIAFRDGDDDGVYEERRTVLHNIPNGRHQTNGMSFGPDGMLYVANGNATDDGIECGPPDGEPCPTGEVKPWSGAILRVDPSWENVDLQKTVRVDDDATFAEDGLDDESVLASPGYRNIYDVDFRPGDPSMIYTPMNGSDFPASNEPLFRLDVTNTQVVGQDAEGNPIEGPVIEDAGFPSCLYGPHENDFPTPQIGAHEHPETFTPENNPNEAVIEKFGECRKNEVHRPIGFFAEAHNGTSGLAFERGDDFPDRYDGDLFVAEWGSIWNVNGGEVSGHKLTHIDIGPDGLPQRRREFLTGGAPIDVTFGPDGAMFVADFQGTIYRITSVMETPDTAAVEIRNGQFVPQVIAIPRDTRVAWVNLDDAAHNVRAIRRITVSDPEEDPPVQSGSEINSPGEIGPREFHAYRFDEFRGTWVYHSTTTPTEENSMVGVVIVAPVDR